MWCSYCGSTAHNINYCAKTWNGQGNLNARYCSYCGSKEHNLDRCSKTWGGQINNRVNPE